MVDTTSDTTSPTRDGDTLKTDTKTDSASADDTSVEDTVTDGEGDASTRSYPCRLAAEKKLSDFIRIDAKRAVNSLRIARGEKDNQIPCGALALYDISDPSNLEILETIIYPNAQIETVWDGDQLIVVAFEYEWSRSSDGDAVVEKQIGRKADIYEVSERKMKRISRSTSPLTSGLGASPPEFKLLNLVSNGDDTILVGENRLANLDIGATGNIVPDRIVDRRSEINRLQDRLDGQVDGSVAYDPNLDRHAITGDGHLLEIEHGVSIWKIPPTNSGNDSSPLVSFLAVPKSIHRYRLPGDQSWTYLEKDGIVYLGEREPVSGDPTPEQKHFELVDVSDRNSPTVAARWHIENDFEDPIEARPNLTSTDDRLYILDSPGRQPDELTIVDVSADPTTIDELGTLRDFGFSNVGDPFRLYAGPENVYFSLSAEGGSGPFDKDYFLRAIRRSELETNF